MAVHVPLPGGKVAASALALHVVGLMKRAQFRPNQSYPLRLCHLGQCVKIAPQQLETVFLQCRKSVSSHSLWHRGSFTLLLRVCWLLWQHAVMCVSVAITDEVPLVMCLKKWNGFMETHCGFSRCQPVQVRVCGCVCACVVIRYSCFLSCCTNASSILHLHLLLLIFLCNGETSKCTHHPL